MFNGLKSRLWEEYGEEYRVAEELAEENAYYRLDEYNPAMLMRLERAIEAGVDPDLFAKRFLIAAGQHRAEMARDLRNAGRYIQRMLLLDEPD